MALYIKKGCLTAAFFISLKANYLFITYIVTSKPKRISVAVGDVHIAVLLSFRFIIELYACVGLLDTR